MKLAYRVALVGTFAAVSLASVAADAAPQAMGVEQACRAVPEAETHLAVLISPADVLWVDALEDGVRLTDGTRAAGPGARIVISARPYTTAQWLHDVIACHFAHNAARGGAQPGSRSPLDVRGAAVHVTSQPGYLIVDVTADDDGAGAEILARARACSPPDQQRTASQRESPPQS
jgi:hypothetical protein